MYNIVKIKARVNLLWMLYFKEICLFFSFSYEKVIDGNYRERERSTHQYWIFRLLLKTIFNNSFIWIPKTFDKKFLVEICTLTISVLTTPQIDRIHSPDRKSNLAERNSFVFLRYLNFHLIKRWFFYYLYKILNKINMKMKKV